MVALSPMVIGGQRPGQQPTSFLNQAEGGGFNHNGAHQAASPTAKARAVARMKLCADAAWSAAHPAFCPEDGSTTGEVRGARLAAMDVTAQESTKPDGEWGPLLPIATTAIHAVVLPTNKVLYFSQPKWPAEDETVDGGNAHVWDPLTNTTTSVPPPVDSYPGRDIPFADGRKVPANLWCAGQTLLPDGRVLVVGGNLEYPINGGNGAGHGFKGGKWVMTFDPWTETWTRYKDMDHGRWYPTLTELPDGRVLIVGGWDETGGQADPGNPAGPPIMSNDQDVEVFDPRRRRARRPPRWSASCRPGSRRRRATRGRTTRASASTRTCSCCPAPRRSDGAATRCWWRDPASTTRRSSTRPTGRGPTSSPRRTPTATRSRTPASPASRATARGAPRGSSPPARTARPRSSCSAAPTPGK